MVVEILVVGLLGGGLEVELFFEEQDLSGGVLKYLLEEHLKILNLN